MPIGNSQTALQLDVIEILTHYFRSDLLVLSAVFGYLLLFLFFYTRNQQTAAWHHWTNLQWPERFLLGFLLGFGMLIFISGGVFYFISVVKERIVLEKVSGGEILQIWFHSSFAVLIMAFVLRMLCEEPLCSTTAHQQIIRFVKNRLVLMVLFAIPFAILAISTITALSSESLYPVTGGSTKELWIGVSIGFLILVFFSIWFPLSVFYFLSGADILLQVLSSILVSFSPVFLLNGLKSKRRAVLAVLIVVILGLITTVADSQIGVLFPKTAYVETHTSDEFEVLGSVTNYTVLIKVNRAFMFFTPYLGIIKNITIHNPSNYSRKLSKDFGAPGFGEISARIAGSEEVAFGAIKDSKNEVLAFNITWNDQSERRPIRFETAFYDRIDPHLTMNLIGTNFSEPIGLGNNTFRQEIRIIFNNSLNLKVQLYQLHVIEVPNEILRFSCVVDGKTTDLCWPRGCDLELVTLSLNPGETKVLTITLEYR